MVRLVWDGVALSCRDAWGLRVLPLRNFNQSINQSINLYRTIVQRRVLQCGYAESKRNVLRRNLNVLTDLTLET